MSLSLCTRNLDSLCFLWYNRSMAKLNSDSYETYLKKGLAQISDRLSLRVYKTDKENIIFIQGEDLRVQIRWDKVRVLDTFIVEKKFWYTSNKERADRVHMRQWADLKLNMLRDAIKRKPKNTKVIAKSSYDPEDYKLEDFEIKSMFGAAALKRHIKERDGVSKKKTSKKKTSKKKAGKKRKSTKNGT